jgi:hypothetical protein
MLSINSKVRSFCRKHTEKGCGKKRRLLTSRGWLRLEIEDIKGGGARMVGRGRGVTLASTSSNLPCTTVRPTIIFPCFDRLGTYFLFQTNEAHGISTGWVKRLALSGPAGTRGGSLPAARVGGRTPSRCRLLGVSRLWQEVLMCLSWYSIECCY